VGSVRSFVTNIPHTFLKETAPLQTSL